MSKRTVSMNPYAQSQALKKEGSGGGTAQSTTLAQIEGINATNLQDATAELYGDIVNVNRFAETVSESLADAYDDTATYNVGDYVTYSGSLYKCNTAVTVPESFDENKWTHILVTDISSDWKLVGTVQGSATIDLPSDYKKIKHTTIYKASNGFSGLLSLVLDKDDIDNAISTESLISGNGYNITSSNMVQRKVSIKNNKINIDNFYWANSDVVANTVSYLYYK